MLWSSRCFLDWSLEYHFRNSKNLDYDVNVELEGNYKLLALVYTRKQVV
jgi:hypothetical protein